MYLKKVEVHGFKSFAQATDVTFEPSITAIVGPNGSGKSNIVDAIRWVLGEQSAKSLRGSKMEDIIFAGTDKRRPMNIAEVRLVLDNSDGKLPIDYSEVSIGRRVQRDGGSDYLINGTVCRLKDVEELMMDTGIGKEAYSIIGQGKIDVILSSKPTDRRELFEEAAGIMKYKNRKLDATKKLDETESNLDRVQDIINELDRQAEPLQKQAEDAQKYKEFTSELKELEESLLLTHWCLYQKELDTYTSDRDRLAASLAEREEMVNSFEAKVEDLQRELDQINEVIDTKQENYFNLKTRRESLENQIQMTREKQKSLVMQQKRIQTEIEEREEMIQRYTEEKERIEKSLVELAQDRSESTQMITQQKQEMEALENQIRFDVEEGEILKANLKEFLNQRSQQESQLRRLQDEEEKLNQRIEELIQLRSRNDQSLDAATRQLHRVEQELVNVDEQLVRLAKEDSALRQHQQSDQTELQQLQDEFNNLREKFQGKQSRLKLLRDMEGSLEGYYQGVKNVLRAKERLSGIIGVVAELLHVDQDKEKAIAAALGGGLQNIVVETGENAKAAIHHLKKTKGGRATFLPLDMVQGYRMNEIPTVRSIDGYLGIAADFVQANEKLLPVVNSLLGRIVIARDMDAALKISRAGKQKLRIVTLDGDNINPGGAVSGGSSHQHSHNLLGRTREIEELTKESDHLRSELEQIKERGQIAKGRVMQQEEQLKSWQREMHQLELKQANLRKDQQQLQKDTEQQEDLLSNVDQEFTTCHEKLDGMAQQIQQFKNQLTQLNATNAQNEAKFMAIEEGIREQRLQIEHFNKDVTERRIRLASIDEQERGYHNRLHQLKDLHAETIQKIQSLKCEWEDLEACKSDLEEQIVAIERNKVVAHSEEEALGVEVNQLKQQEKDFSGAFKKEDSRARSLRRKVNELSKEVNQHEVKIAELSSKLENIIEQLKEEHDIDLIMQPREIIPIEDRASVEKQIRSLKWRLRVLGTVNLAAEEEYETLTKRLSFLKEQVADLSQAKDKLMEMISELDETIKERFFETFEKVKVEFRQAFTHLFNGGTAELHLSDPDDLLNTGVDINAQPPGKKLQKLTLMSGGEKALTALALIFSFLKVKPSPFYILDEIDAPLDEANVERYASYVREFCSTSQFIIITHRKGTMAEADALYGVTMEESGVSKLISYKFDEKAS